MTFDYRGFLNGLDINSGDVLDVASDLMSIAMYCKSKSLSFDPNDLIDEICEYIGDEGTIAIRSFNWDFCKGVPYDIKKSPSKVGSLGNAALKRTDFKRTKHPLYSWLVKGKLKEELCALTNVNSFGKGTPFDVFYKHNGKLLIMGNPNISTLTQYHHAEKLAEVPYRKEKVFRGEYYDYDGTCSVREYSMYVRPLNVTVEYDAIENGDFEIRAFEKGWVKRKVYDEILRCKTFDIVQITDFFVDDLRNNAGVNVVDLNGMAGYKHDGWDEKLAAY